MDRKKLENADDLFMAALRKPVVLRVIRRGSAHVLATFVAIAGAGLLGAVLWGAALAALGVLPERAWPILAVLTVLVVLVGALVGATRLTVRAACSDVLCEGAPEADALACPGCGRTIVEPHRRIAARRPGARLDR